MFKPLPPEMNLPAAEKSTLEFWREKDIFHRSQRRRSDAPRFVFYEGPPTANGRPHPGHALTRAMKDLFPRYKTMTGHLCERKAGWDTHGLPVETEVSKELGIHTKAEIEAYGIEPFVRLCIESVSRYMREWEEFTARLGFWVDLDQAYATYQASYVESVWWSLKTLYERGLLYRGHKVVWWWPQGGTALSAGEVGEGYRTVDDPSVFVLFPLVDPPEALRDTSLVVWTTTPWTLVSNHFAAVHPEFMYTVLRDRATGRRLLVASELADTLAEKAGIEVDRELELSGRDLVGLRYRPPFEEPYYARYGEVTGKLAEDGAGSDHLGWRVLAAGFVTLDSGTGLVHEAPAFGEVDFELWKQEAARFSQADALPLLCAVEPDGTFGAEAGEELRGRYIKDADREIIRMLKDRGLLLHRETYRHEYPFCPRADQDPLIQYARASWFVRTSAFKQEFLENNAAIEWLPAHIKDGRFGDFLRNNVDWALSRERFWGTPLPIWRCDATGYMEAVDSYAALLAKEDVQGTEVWDEAKRQDPALPDDLRLHRPYIDAVHYASPRGKGARMRRVTEVIDCWWDAGSMPFAQWGFPHAPGSRERLRERYPADFISEAIDQTRGWFYGLLAINTLLWGEGASAEDRSGGPEAEAPHPYRACITLAHVMGEDGKKMSKSKKNYREPAYVFDAYGADAMRWYFFSAQPPWTPVQFREDSIRDSQREYLLRLYNVFSFFNIYARIDGFRPRAEGGLLPTGWRPVAERSELDRWMIGLVQRTTLEVRERMDAFENYPAAGALRELVDALSNWYVRRSRGRFWRSIDGASPAEVADKWDAYNTLLEVLVDIAKLSAPFTPFLAEVVYRNIVGEPAEEGGWEAEESVHMCDYPEADMALVDERLLVAMDLVRQVVSLGHSARSEAEIKVRQSLAEVKVIAADEGDARLLERHASLIAEELNVRRVEFPDRADDYVAYSLKANFKVLGPRRGALAPRIAAALAKLDDRMSALKRSQLAETGTCQLEVDGQDVSLVADEVEVRLSAQPGWSAAQGRSAVVVVNTELDEELREEGLVREVVHHVQALRKSMDLLYQARIELRVEASPKLAGVLDRHRGRLMDEVLAARFDAVAVERAEVVAAGASEAVVGGGLPGGRSKEVDVEGEAVRISAAVIDG